MAEKATIVNIWYKYFPRERRSADAIYAEITRREGICNGLNKIRRDISAIGRQATLALESIKACEKQVTPQMTEFKIILAQERAAWANVLKSVVEQNRMIREKEEGVQTAIAVNLGKKDVDAIKKEVNEVSKTLEEALKGFQILLRKIFRAELRFLPFYNDVMLSDPKSLANFFSVMPKLKAKNVLEAA